MLASKAFYPGWRTSTSDYMYYSVFNNNDARKFMDTLVMLWIEVVVAYFKVPGFRLNRQVKKQTFQENRFPRTRLESEFLLNRWREQ
jgi:hypothetical protein